MHRTEYWSAVWRLWVDKDDVYLATRNNMGLAKLSLHSSGKWRYAWTRESGVLAMAADDRVEKRWDRPNPFRPGWTQGPAVVIPITPIERPFARLNRDSKPVHWTAQPAVGSASYFTVLFADPSVDPTTWRSVARPGDAAISLLPLLTAGSVLLMNREQPMDGSMTGYIEKLRAGLQIMYPDSPPSELEASAFTIDTDSNGHPYVLDVAIGWANVRSGAAA